MFAVFAALAIAAGPIPDKFSGGFIQLTDDIANNPDTRLDQKEWGQVLAAVQVVKMNTIILQQLAYREKVKGQKKDFCLLRPGQPDDALEAILIEAKKRGMTVFLGLWNADFSEEDFKDETFLDEARKKSDSVLATLKSYPKYLQYESFGGWYLPIEPWNFNEKSGETKRLRKHYLGPLSEACKAVADKPVAFSCYFNPNSTQLADPATTTTVYKNVLNGLKIDILLPQDGVGERGNSADACKAYFKAFKDACDANGVQMWAILECFTLGMDGYRYPARASRLSDQFANARGLATSFVTYDFFHYMNPREYFWADGKEMEGLCAGGYAAGRRILFEAYWKLIMVGP